MIRFACPKCHKVYKAADDQEGKQSLCKQCGSYVLIPKPITGVPLPPVASPHADVPPHQDRTRGGERDISRTKDDDWWDEQPTRQPVQGVAVAAAAINLVFAVVALCGACCLGPGAVGMMRGEPVGSATVLGLGLLGCGLLNLVGVGLMIMTGIGLLTRRRYGRTLGFLSAGLGLVNALGMTVILVASTIVDRNIDTETILGCLIPVALWLAYSIACLILLGKVRPQPR